MALHVESHTPTSNPFDFDVQRKGVKQANRYRRTRNTENW